MHCAASYVGVKKELLPAYLDPNVITNVEELMSGVSFASAGSGYDPLTPTISVCIYQNSFFSAKPIFDITVGISDLKSR
jgi:hypothetical protein